MNDPVYDEVKALVAEHQPELYRIALHECRGAADPAQDARERIQDALLKVYLRWDMAKQRDPLAYTITVLKNECISAHRARTAKKRPPQVLTDPMTVVQLHDEVRSATAEDQVIRKIDEWPRLRSLLNRLKPPYPEILFRRFYLDHSVQQVSEDMGMPAGTVKWSTSKACEQVRDMAAQDEEATR